MKHRSVSRFARNSFYIPREHVPKLLVDLGKVSPVWRGGFELDGWLPIVKRFVRFNTFWLPSIRHAEFWFG